MRSAGAGWASERSTGSDSGTAGEGKGGCSHPSQACTPLPLPPGACCSHAAAIPMLLDTAFGALISGAHASPVRTHQHGRRAQRVVQHAHCRGREPQRAPCPLHIRHVLRGGGRAGRVGVTMGSSSRHRRNHAHRTAWQSCCTPRPACLLRAPRCAHHRIACHLPHLLLPVRLPAAIGRQLMARDEPLLLLLGHPGASHFE